MVSVAPVLTETRLKPYRADLASLEGLVVGYHPQRRVIKHGSNPTKLRQIFAADAELLLGTASVAAALRECIDFHTNAADLSGESDFIVLSTRNGSTITARGPVSLVRDGPPTPVGLARDVIGLDCRRAGGHLHTNIRALAKSVRRINTLTQPPAPKRAPARRSVVAPLVASTATTATLLDCWANGASAWQVSTSGQIPEIGHEERMFRHLVCRGAALGTVAPAGTVGPAFLEFGNIGHTVLTGAPQSTHPDDPTAAMAHAAREMWRLASTGEGSVLEHLCAVSSRAGLPPDIESDEWKTRFIAMTRRKNFLLG